MSGKTRLGTEATVKPIARWHLLLLLVLAVVGCTPTPPRFGNFGGPLAEQPAVQTVSQSAAQTYGPPRETDWFPVQARFHPDGKRMVVNFCHVDAAYYCRLAEYDIGRKSWALLPGQREGVSYTYPSYSNDGTKLVFSIAPCSPDRKDCNTGYGQLATMPARGGPLALLPMHDARRAHFTADDRRLTYWRVKTTGKLASGRSFGSFSVYEYDLASGAEAPLIESMESAPGKPYGVRFIADLTAPRYTVDGKTLFFCALNDSTYLRDPVTERQLVHAVPGWAANCFFYEPANRAYTLISTDRAGFKLGRKDFGDPYLQHPRLGFLAGPGRPRLVDPVTLNDVWIGLHDPRPLQMADADLNQQGNTVVAVTGTKMYKNGEHARKGTFFIMEEDPRRDHSKPQTYHREAPILALIDIATRQATPLEWPDIAKLPELHQH